MPKTVLPYSPKSIDTPGENPTHWGFEVNIAGHAAGGLATYLSEQNYGHTRDGKPYSLMAIPGLEDYWGTGIFATEALTREAIKALDLLRSQLDTHPRNADGGFWHKKIYENQMWLDGLYMGQPFYAEYAYRNNRVNDYADIINQFVTVARHNYDPKTDLYRHACDVSKREKWADKTTGWSQHCWGRAMGWYAMACVDVLDFIPEHEAGRESVIEILNKLAAQIKRTQDPATGVWYQVIDRSGDEGNYLESSCSTMFVYTLLKALRKGYICPSYMEVAKKGYEGLLTQFIEVDNKGVVSITKGCAVAGLGGKPVYRTGDYNYYITEKIRSNDAKAVGPFIMASLEWERLFQKSSCGTACK